MRAQFLAAVQNDYAAGVQFAFAGMAIAMAVVAALGVLYPKGVVSSATPADAPVAVAV